MDNLKRYNTVFASVFEVDENELNEDFKVGSVDNWDSITQLSLVSDLEDEFDIMIDSEDILGFRSYNEGKEILAKYEISF